MHSNMVNINILYNVFIRPTALQSFKYKMSNNVIVFAYKFVTIIAIEPLQIVVVIW